MGRLVQFVIWVGLASLVVAPILARLIENGMTHHWYEVMKGGIAYSTLLGLTISSVPYGIQLAHTRYNQCLLDRCGFAVFLFTAVLVLILTAVTTTTGSFLVAFALSEEFRGHVDYPSNIGRFLALTIPFAFVMCFLLNWQWVRCVDPFTEIERSRPSPRTDVASISDAVCAMVEETRDSHAAPEPISDAAQPDLEPPSGVI